jgi:RNA polymerase sigma-70 factor (ECF subfamily)
MTIHDSNALVLAMQSGECRAYEKLLDNLGPRLLATARRMCGTESDAHDVLQDACVSCFKNIADFKGESSIYTWLHRIVVTTALMRLRKKKRRGEASVEPLLPTYYDDGHRVDARTEWPESPHAAAEKQESRELVRQYIDQLPANYREVVMLRDIEELDTTETAKLLGVNEGVVKTRLHRARQALRTLLEPHFVEKEVAEL